MSSYQIISVHFIIETYSVHIHMIHMIISYHFIAVYFTISTF